MRRTAIHTIRFVAFCDSGLHIGGSQDELTIGGADNPVIKNPETRRPYIPGSSLKGKMRAELEKETGRVNGRREDEPCGCDDCSVCRVFGAHKNCQPPDSAHPESSFATGSCAKVVISRTRRRTSSIARPERLSIRVRMSGSSKARNSGCKSFCRCSISTSSSRTRIETATLHQGDEALQAVVADGLGLVQMTGLGGGTSRGSGAVRFEDFEMDGRPWIHWSA